MSAVRKPTSTGYVANRHQTKEGQPVQSAPTYVNSRSLEVSNPLSRILAYLTRAHTSLPRSRKTNALVRQCPPTSHKAYMRRVATVRPQSALAPDRNHQRGSRITYVEPDNVLTTLGLRTQGLLRLSNYDEWVGGF